MSSGWTARRPHVPRRTCWRERRTHRIGEAYIFVGRRRPQTEESRSRRATTPTAPPDPPRRRLSVARRSHGVPDVFALRVDARQAALEPSRTPIPFLVDCLGDSSPRPPRCMSWL